MNEEQQQEAFRKFIQDIKSNLVEWSVVESSTLYRTPSYWYDCRVEEVNGEKVVICQRYANGGGQPMIARLPAEEVPIGKQWLRQPDQRQKRTNM